MGVSSRGSATNKTNDRLFTLVNCIQKTIYMVNCIRYIGDKKYGKNLVGC